MNRKWLVVVGLAVFVVIVSTIATRRRPLHSELEFLKPYISHQEDFYVHQESDLANMVGPPKHISGPFLLVHRITITGCPPEQIDEMARRHFADRTWESHDAIGMWIRDLVFCPSNPRRKDEWPDVQFTFSHSLPTGEQDETIVYWDQKLSPTRVWTLRAMHPFSNPFLPRYPSR